MSLYKISDEYDIFDFALAIPREKIMYSKLFNSYIKLYSKLDSISILYALTKLDYDEFIRFESDIFDIHQIYMSTEYVERDLLKSRHQNILAKYRYMIRLFR